MGNLRLELAFLIPDDKKLTVKEVQLTVANAIEAITAETLRQMKDGAVKFNSLEDLTGYDERLHKLKTDWNSEQKAKAA